MQVAPESEEDREYQRFLSSLLPNEQENLSFLDEEDEEYRPDEDDDEHEDDEARRGVSKKELTDLLLDSTHMTFPKTPGIVPLEPRKEVANGPNGSDGILAVPSLVMEEGTMEIGSNMPGVKDPSLMDTTPPAFQGRQGAVTQAQCIQLASQMHKHLQLLLQSYHLLAKGTPTPALAECRAMIEELQQRGEKALRYKNALLSKLNPATTGADSAVNPAEVEDDISTGRDKNAPNSDPAPVQTSGGNANTTENLLALRRVTRSLTAAHAAVAHPSMFELVGSQTVDELSAGFARGCSLEERNRAIQEQMLQLDTHLLSARKHRRSKRGFSASEDALLADGVKRFGSHLESWEQIQKHFLPLVSPQNIRQRYKYLTGKKSGMSAVKAFHQKTSRSSDTSWLLEEDVRIARGLVELHDEKHQFARLAKTYLPHRSRLEIRKRWARVIAKFRVELAEIGLTAPKDNSLDLAVAMKEYLEDKLRDRMLRQQGEADLARFDAARQLQQLGQGTWDDGSTSESGSVEKVAADDADSCKTKNLHPALFFSSWSFISPATLLNSTCKHNWPSFMDEGQDKNKSHVDETTAATDSALLGDTFSTTEDSQLFDTMRQVPLPMELSGTPNVQETEVSGERRKEMLQFGRVPQVGTALAMPQKRSDEDDEEDDDSDYEHDELLSSDSDSEFEQMELSDDDDMEDDEGSVDTFEHDTLLSDSDDQSAESVESFRTPSRSPESSPSQPSPSPPPRSPARAGKSSQRIHHPLRLQNLGQPGNERMKRALAALERRIVGKSISGPTSTSSAVPQKAPTSTKRPKRKVASTLIAPLDASRRNTPLESGDGSFFSGSTNGTAAHNDSESEDNDDWDDGSGDEGFEVDELPSSSDEFNSDIEEHKGEPVSSGEPGSNGQEGLTGTAACSTDISLPNKKPKLQQRCTTCGHVTCTCSSSTRMQLLLRRMKEKRSSPTL